MGLSGCHIATIIITFVLWIVDVILSAVSETQNNIFPRAFGEVLAAYQIEITQVDGTGILYWIEDVWKAIILIYLISTIFRSGEQCDILSFNFYIYFNINSICSIIFSLDWAREQFVWSFVMCVLMSAGHLLMLYHACKQFHAYSCTHDETSENKHDVAFHKWIIQNGVLLSTAHYIYDALFFLGIVFTYTFKVNSHTSSVLALVLSAVAMVAWFILETFAVPHHTPLTFTAYIAFAWSFIEVHVHAWEKYESVATLNLILLVASLLMFVARLVIVGVRCYRKSSYETIGYDANSQQVTSA